MAARALTLDAVAARTGVDPKTVQRWLAGRVPHARHRWAIAALVREDEAYLWPAVARDGHQPASAASELVTLYPHRADVPPSLWRTLFDQVRQDLAILVYAAVFLPNNSSIFWTSSELRQMPARPCASPSAIRPVQS